MYSCKGSNQVGQPHSYSPWSTAASADNGKVQFFEVHPLDCRAGYSWLQSPAIKFIKSCKIMLTSSSSQLLQRFLFISGLQLDLRVTNSSLQMVTLCHLVWRVFASCQLSKNHWEQVAVYHCGPLSHLGQPLCYGLCRILERDPLSEVRDVPFGYHEDFTPNGSLQFFGAGEASEARRKRVTK